MFNLIKNTMKKSILAFLVIVLALSLASCNSNTTALNEMGNICEKIEKNFDKYTEKEFKELTERFSELEKKLESGELSESEEKELAKVKGRYYGAFTKGAIKATKKEIKKITDNLENAVEGFIEGIK